MGKTHGRAQFGVPRGPYSSWTCAIISLFSNA